MSKPRIFMIGYSTDKGGVESYIKNLCSQLENDFDIILHWPIMEIDGKRWVKPRNRHNPIKYHSFWRRFFKENHFDVVYFNTCDIVSIDLLKFAANSGVPVRIIHSHCTANQNPGTGLRRIVHNIQETKSRKNLSKYATDLLACSKSAGDWMFDEKDYTLISNGIDIDKYVFSLEKFNNKSSLFNSQNHKTIACLGRLDNQKNPFFSLEIFKAACEITSKLQCLFIGDGEHRRALESKTRDYGLQDKIHFTGGVDNVNEWLSCVDALLMPSLFEGLPFALVEAQAAGIHSLVSDTVSAEANITGLVEYMSLTCSAEEWAQRLLELAQLPREDKREALVKAGFSIAESAKTVKETILNRLNK